MKTWKHISHKYADYLSNKKLAKPNIRLSQLSRIEQYLQEIYPGILKGNADFIHISKFELRSRYEKWKGKKINGAESQVFNDFYKLARL
jgi:hypothetical protein